MRSFSRVRSRVRTHRRAAPGGLRRRLGLALVLFLLTLALPSDGHLGAAREDFLVARATAGRQFNLVAWEIQAVSQKLNDLFRQPGAGLTPQQEHDLVREYILGVGRTGELTRQIEAAAAGVRAEGQGADDLARQQAADEGALAALRDRQEAIRPAVERILEKQVSLILDELGFTTLGQVFPPVSFQFTESPNYLIVSPRHRIRIERGVYLDPAMPLDEIMQIENEVARDLAASTIIEGTGGFSSYPTMVLQYSVLSWVVETVAHEWAHTYLTLHPLGWRYATSPAMRTINETVSSMVGSEVSDLLLARFYPELIGPAPWPVPLSKRADWLSKAPVPPAFEFGAFMRETRLETDRLLAAGQIDEAEKYMEARRQELVARGYAIRKLNQAYFAFHGSYQTSAIAAGTDPIGGKLRALRLRSAGLPQFVRIVSEFRQGDDLDAALAV